MTKRIDVESLIGQRFGNFTVLSFLGRDSAYRIIVSTRCDCGAIVPVDFFRIKYGNTKSCGCLKYTGLLRKKTDVSQIMGQRFGRLTVIGDAGQNKRTATKVLTRCECGTEKTLLLQTLRSGDTKSCGCYNLDSSRERATTHGLNRTPLHMMWKGMKSRCYNKNMQNYKHYGGRGITVCDEWRSNFKAFYDFAMANGWEKGLEVDRTNNDLGYSPENCRFVTHKVNCNNRRPRKRAVKRGLSNVVSGERQTLLKLKLAEKEEAA
jgi:hypothetical protein